jgi:tetratricopeptide (TPR) repeat protein
MRKLLIMRYLLPSLLSLLVLTPGALAASDLDVINRAVQAGKIVEANGMYQQLVAKNQQRADYHLSYAKFLRATGQNETALQEFQTVLQLKPGQTDATVGLAEMSLQMLDLENAIRYSQSALNSDPKSKEAGMIYASACMQSGRTTAADNELAVLLKGAPDGDLLHLAYQIKARKGDFLQARTYLQEAVGQRPDQIEWMLELCKILETSGDYETSRNYLQSALDRQPNAVDARVALARNLEVFENDYDKAIGEYQKVLATDPNSPKALAGIDRCRAKKNDLALRLKLGLQSMFNHH